MYQTETETQRDFVKAQHRSFCGSAVNHFMNFTFCPYKVLRESVVKLFSTVTLIRRHNKLKYDLWRRAGLSDTTGMNNCWWQLMLPLATPAFTR